MPKLKRDKEYRELYARESTGTYYAKKYLPGYGEVLRALGTKDRKIAIRRLDRALHALSRLQDEVTIDEIAESCLEYYQTKSFKTYESFELHWRAHLKPFFSGIPIKAVGEHWDNYKAYERQRNPKRKLRHDRKHLRFILGWAQRKGKIAIVPVLSIERSDLRRERGRVIKANEIRSLLDCASPEWKLKITLYQTGMRSGEVSKLKWADIDLGNGIVRLRAETVKTREARLFALPRSVVRDLKIRKLNSESVFVFPHRDDPSRHETATDKSFQRLKRRAGVTLKRHHFRHTAASAALSGGLNPSLVTKALGMSERILNDIYFHLDEEDAKTVAKVISKKIRGGQ